MPAPLLLDTDVLIDYLRGQTEAVAFLKRTRHPLCVSAVTVAELYIGVREGEERQKLDLFIELMNPLPVTPEIARQAGLWRRDYAKSHGVGLIDAIIAATAKLNDCTLATLNKKHFPMIDGILVPYRKT